MKNKHIRRMVLAAASVSMLLSPVSAFAQAPAAVTEEAAQSAVDRRLLAQSIATAESLKAEGALTHVNAIVVRKFETALAAAKEVNAKEDATQAEVNEAWLNLANAIQLLGFKSDKTELLALIQEAESLDHRDFYETGKDELEAALAYAKQVAGDDTALNDQSIKAAADRLRAAIDALEAVEIIELYRVYNPNSGEHVFTVDADERDHLISVGWNDEGIAWNLPALSPIPVYRVYNPNAGDHHYTTDKEEYDHLITVGWRGEGIKWYSDHKQTQEIHRLYNPNAKAGAHHFTIDKEESDRLVSYGWRYEGVNMHAR